MKRRTLKPIVAQPHRPEPSSSYPCPEMHAPAVRPGADDADSHPSRMGDRLHYRGGRVTDLQGNLLEESQT